MAAVVDYFDELEIGFCLRVNRFGRTAWVRRFFSVISRFGDGWFWIGTAALLIALQGTASIPAVAQIALTGGAGVLLYKLLKHRLVRERPYITNGEILCGAAPLDRYSFPSGHTLHAVSFTVMFTHFEPLLTPLAVTFAALVAVSRIVLGLHYPSDVIVGAVIGACLAVSSLAVV